MEAKAILKYLKTSPQKTRLVIDLIRGKKVDEAITILTYSEKAVSRELVKLVKSAVANAENTKNLNVDKLFVKTAFVDGGPVLKRTHSKAMGRGALIRRRTSHVTVVLGER
ncbi:MAG: 50S ribosomal protein L22 [Deltaproteobacteria bacterium]|jgi:large subunit ribosomal protein L22|uniref:Large ribosomal subunit protein uL22 n=1 Tax=uncultured delta proteobacterium Rifle_16ft_4_minimus_12842 TaxID=1665174 RepID=A0A0H4T0C2_9DELT|nr:50S ribosomal protein L22, large subunit ribosomal protein L22 [uncultured delta proteobacterium Rifle_16ft_4_minimus_12842]MBI2400336.1 50S ribosomal protein L22 [Deltaproteobacteria bacterium]OGP14780.1 MAG: 50S ribosomal protein L22 [Deltaproteobacteria bacterium GWA2_54_12]